MPVITVNGVPPDTKNLETLWNNLRHEISRINALELSKDQITVFFPADLLAEGLGEEIIVFVNGLFPKPKRTFEVLRLMAQNIAFVIERFAKEHWPQCQLIEVFVIPFNPTKQPFVSKKIK